MTWLLNFLKSSIGMKVVMSLTGLFLITFLFVHLIGNIQLLFDDNGESFNTYAHFMTTNPLVKFVSFGLYFFIILHTIQGIMLASRNNKSRGVKYAKTTNTNASWASKNMIYLGLLILAFLCIHMGDFWWKMKMGQLEMVSYEGVSYEMDNLYGRVYAAFQVWWVVVIYIIGLIALTFHLLHGFSSAFQSLGLNHKKYTPLINLLGNAYAILIPVGFAIIPLYVFFTNLN